MLELQFSGQQSAYVDGFYHYDGFNVFYFMMDSMLFCVIHNFMNTLMVFSMRKLVSKIGASVLERVLSLGNKPWRILVVVMPP